MRRYDNKCSRQRNAPNPPPAKAPPQARSKNVILLINNSRGKIFRTGHTTRSPVKAKRNNNQPRLGKPGLPSKESRPRGTICNIVHFFCHNFVLLPSTERPKSTPCRNTPPASRRKRCSQRLLDFPHWTKASKRLYGHGRPPSC